MEDRILEEKVEKENRRRKKKGKEKNETSKKDGTEKFAMKNSTEEEKLNTFLCMDGGKLLKVQFYDE